MTPVPSLMEVWPALAGSFAVCSGLVITQRWRGRLSLDHDLSGVQKLHHKPVPRIGGLGLFGGLLAAALAGWVWGGPHALTALILLLCALPAFLGGLIEDLTKRVPVRIRLLASFLSGGLAALVLGAHLNRLDTPMLDVLVSSLPLSVVFTAFAVGGVTNAVNIIDGLNGLASGCVALMLGGLGAIAWMHNDALVLYLCLIGIAAVLGFMLLNYPFGSIFLGDGGAYLAGFWLAECAVLLLVRNEAVSTWAPLLACFYPVWETGFSMYRRSFIRKTNSGRPDMVHFHHLLFRVFVTTAVGRGRAAWLRHGLTSMLLWQLVFICQLVASLFSTSTVVLSAATVLLAGAYYWAYGMLAADSGADVGQQHPITSEPVALEGLYRNGR